MQEINVYDRNNKKVVALVQWDNDIFLRIKESGITNAYNVHFFNSRSTQSYVMESTYSNGVLETKVPNVLLTEAFPIIGYVYVENGDGGRSEYVFQIGISKRPKPGDFISIDTQDYVTISSIRFTCADYAQKAEERANASEAFASESENSAKLSKSYAVGEAGVRDGENEDNAKYYSQVAEDHKETALAHSKNSEQSAVRSATSAEESSVSAQLAEESAGKALASEKAADEFQKVASVFSDAAGTYAGDAHDSLLNAQKQAEAALAHKNAAALSEKNAKTSENAAKQSEDTVLQRITDADMSAELAESWAAGGTGTRSGEDTDNAKYYSEQSSAHRTQSKDHAILAQSYAIGGTGTRSGEDTDNAKYFYGEMQKLVGNLNFATVDEIKTYIGF